MPTSDPQHPNDPPDQPRDPQAEDANAPHPTAGDEPSRDAGHAIRKGPRNVTIDLGAIQRILRWSLDMNRRQRELVQSALDVIESAAKE